MMDENSKREHRIQHGFHHVGSIIRKLELQSAELIGTLQFIIGRFYTMASDLQALRDELAQVQQMVADDNAQDQAAVDVLNQKIKDLEAQVAAGGQVDTSEFIATLETIKALIKPVV